MRIFQRSSTTLLGALVLIPLAAASAQAEPVTLSEPVAAAIDGDGTGLCMASAVSNDPGTDFGNLNEVNYTGSINRFMEEHETDRVEYVIQTLFDLSNNNNAGTQASYGDFQDAMPDTCQTGGCGFFVNDTTTSFGSRVRGFFNVTPDLVDQPVHFGFYADDSISLTFFDKNSMAHPVIVRPPQLGLPTWRVTETVIFEQPGLYPLELLYVEIADHAALEMSYFVGTFTDFERSAQQEPITQLDDVGFQLFAPTAFFQTISGVPSVPDFPDVCNQCDRQYVNLPGNNGCFPGYYCNEAALCAPCDTALFCGPSCSPCGGDTPFCVNRNGTNECVQCREDDDCRPGYLCDPETSTCHECNTDADCGRGLYCVDHSCEPCSTADECAGSSCNCCPAGPGGEPMQCATLDSEDTPVCVECTDNADCASGVCDVLVGQCVDALAANQRPDCCGDSCVPCPADYPYCLPGPFGTACAQCRWDTDCPDGNFCLSGTCLPCTEDRHCGPRCTSCGGDTPYCLDAQIAERATCVQCEDDSHCNGGTCNPTTNECEFECTVSCPDETPYCMGQQCVECYADTQCPCGGTCDLATNTCSSSCRSNTDCLGVQHCRWNDKGDSKECALGPMPSDAACGSTLATACDSNIGGRPGNRASGPWILAMALLALALSRRRRQG